MSKNDAIFCDGCGKEIPSYNAKEWSAKIMVWGVGINRYSGGIRSDLCEDCYNKFVAFLESDISAEI